MAQITFITVGSIKERYLTDALAEYKKRLSQFAKISEVEIKEERIVDEDNRREISDALDREADKILSAVPQGSALVALCIEGKQLSSEELAATVGSAIDESGKLTFVIGSSHGLSDRVKSAARIKLSFSRLTFPHQLMRVVLFEAIYRSFTILAGKRYHK